MAEISQGLPIFIDRKNSFILSQIEKPGIWWNINWRKVNASYDLDNRTTNECFKLSGMQTIDNI